MATPLRWGTEFLINTTTPGIQFLPSITALADGRFVVAWDDRSLSPDDPSGAAIRAQLFNADGSRSGAEFLVNTTTTNNQSTPSITALADGRFVVAWEDFSTSPDDPSNSAIRAQMFNADGSRSGAEFLVNTTTHGFQVAPSITALADGRFVVAWGDGSFSPDDAFAVRAQVFNADGSASGAEFRVNTTTFSTQSEPSITALADGRFVVAWQDSSAPSALHSGFDVRAQVFNADGSHSGAEFLVNTTINDNQVDPRITALADGRFVVVWSDISLSPDDPSSLAVRAQVFNADGSHSGAEFLVNTTTTGSQAEQSITALADGRFVVAWTDDSHSTANPSGIEVLAQVFNADGTRSGAEFLVNTTTPGFQSQPSITALADGRFAVAWHDISASPDDPSGSAVRGQTSGAREAAVDLNGTPATDD